MIAIRAGTRQDAGHLVRLVNLAGEGMPLALWTQNAAPGTDPWEYGRSRARRDHGAFSWTKAVMAEIDGRVAGTIMPYRVPDSPDVIDADTPAMFVPLIELENHVPGSFYINVLATYPDARHKGVARALMAHAERMAAGAPQSLIVADGNRQARALYASLGFAEQARRPLVTDGWRTDSSAWVLMVKK